MPPETSHEASPGALPPEALQPETLKIAVVVPVWGQWPLVPRLLADLAAQTRAPAAVILVNNEAPAPPALDPALLAPGIEPRIDIVPCPAPGSYAARNAGAAAALASLARSPALLAFTDADCHPDPGWLAALAAAAAETPGALLAGPVRMEPPEPRTAAGVLDMVRGIPQARYVSRGYAATANLAVPAAVFTALGGFDAARRSGGDAEFCRRAGRAGHPLRLVPEAVVAHPSRADWAELAAKARRVKGGQVAAGPLPRRAAWVLRSLCPPLTDARLILAAPFPWRDRRLAAAARLRLWAVELAELTRLLAGGPPERR